MVLCIDGVDFCGKDTIAQKLKKYFLKNHKQTVISAFHHPENLAVQLPPVLKNNKDILDYIKYAQIIVETIKKLEGDAFTQNETIQLLFSSITPLHNKVIQTLRNHDITVILPRSWTSTYAYCQTQDKKTLQVIKAIKELWASIDFYVFLNVDENTILKRKKSRMKLSSETILKDYEDDLNFLNATNKKYQLLSAECTSMLVDAKKDPETILEEIVAKLKHLGLNK